jgi:hypothetical protein
MLLTSAKNPLVTLPALLTVGLALSIGWGIRGNYGHEHGAMLPGALAALAAVAFSGRDDWQRRAVYFAFFGALGWGFGGSISYMQVVGYTHSGHEPSQLFGYYSLFAIGFLWAAVGGAGTALPAVLARRSLVDLVAAFLPLFAIWIVLYLVEAEVIEPQAIAQRIESLWNRDAPVLSPDANVGETDSNQMKRHEHPLYWLDSDWLVVGIILVGIAAVDLIRRRFRGLPYLVLLVGIGSAVGVATQAALGRAGLLDVLADNLVHIQGDTSRFPAEQLLTNWPNFLPEVIPFVGWGVGAILGAMLYFILFGAFSGGLSLYLYMAVGWYVGFLGLAVFANLHMTPPRGDSWAGMTGMILAIWIYFLRHRLWPALLASIVCGIVGGIGFSGCVWLKLFLVSFGNPALLDDPTAIQEWAHYQSANWHSVLEQTYGFVNGIGLATALAILVRRVPPVDDAGPRSRWAEVFALLYVLPVMTFINMTRNVEDWTNVVGGRQAVPSLMKAPLRATIELTAWGWFVLFFAIASLGVLAVALIQGRRKIALIPDSGLGRCQLLFQLILWVFVIGNIGKAVVNFHEQRLITEGMILVNAVMVTVLLLALGTTLEIPMLERPRWAVLLVASWVIGGLIAGFLPIGLTRHTRTMYADKHAGHSKLNLRFGDEANWRNEPNLRGTPHR